MIQRHAFCCRESRAIQLRSSSTKTTEFLDEKLHHSFGHDFHTKQQDYNHTS